MVLYNPNIVFASQTSNRQELTPTQLEQGYVRQSPISSSEQNGSEYIKSLGLSQMYLQGNQYQSVIQYKYGMQCTIVYVASPTNVYLRHFVVKKESAWQTPITDTPPLKNASVTTEGDIYFWSGGEVDEDNWQETTQNVDNVTIVQRNGVLTVSGDYLANIGELKLGLWDIGEQPFGFYPLAGDEYPITSPVAQQIINYAPASIKKLFHITGTTLTFPDFVSPMSTGNEFGYFPRFGRMAGQKRGDAIRNITGQFQTNQGDIRSVSGAFTNNGMDRASGYLIAGNDIAFVGFDSSQVVPTASENRPQAITVIPYIYTGVEYQPPAPDPINEWIEGKIISEYGYLEKYVGDNNIGYLNKFIPIEAGVTYALNPIQCVASQLTLPAVIPPLPVGDIERYPIGYQYDANHNPIAPIVLQINTDEQQTNATLKRNFYYFTADDSAVYIKLNMQQEQLATYRISKANNLFDANSTPPPIQEGNQWKVEDLPTIDDLTQTYYKQFINQIRLGSQTTGAGYSINNPRPNQAYYGIWQDFKVLYPAGTIEQYSTYTLYVTDANKNKACFWFIDDVNIYSPDATPTPPPTVNLPEIIEVQLKRIGEEYISEIPQEALYNLDKYNLSLSGYDNREHLIVLGKAGTSDFKETSMLSASPLSNSNNYPSMIPALKPILDKYHADMLPYTEEKVFMNNNMLYTDILHAVTCFSKYWNDSWTALGSVITSGLNEDRTYLQNLIDNKIIVGSISVTRYSPLAGETAYFIRKDVKI